MVAFFDPGQMTARLDLEVPQALPDGQGGATLAWQVQASVWARIEPVSFVVEEPGASAETGTVSQRIWLHYRNDVEPGQRLRKGGRIFVVRLVHDPDETRRYLVCHCEEEA